MLDSIRSTLRSPDLRTKILITLGVLALYRLGSFIPAPGVNAGNVQQCLSAGSAKGGIYDMVNMFSGGALLSVSILALGVMPYITASIMLQLLKVIVPRLQELHAAGDQATVTQYTRYLTVGMSALNATTIVTLARTGRLLGTCPLPIVTDPGVLTSAIMIIALTAGSLLVMWMGEKITERGIGNGMSLLIFTSVVSSFPTALGTIGRTQGWGVFAAVMAVGLVVIGLVVFVEQSQRRVPVVYAKRQAGSRVLGGNTTFLPIKVNMAGVIPVIFASTLLSLPTMIAQFAKGGAGGAGPEWAQWVTANLTQGDHPVYMVVYTLFIIGFSFFYVSITFDPKEISENMKKHGGFVPGLRPGRPTARMLKYVSDRVTTVGALYIGIIALIPLVALVLLNANQNFPFGGSAILIMVGVGLDTVKQIKSQTEQRSYPTLMR